MWQILGIILEGFAYSRWMRWWVAVPFVVIGVDQTEHDQRTQTVFTALLGILDFAAMHQGKCYR